MPQIYNHTKIEEKWLQHWEENKLFLQTEGQKVKDIKDKVNGEAREGALGYKMYLLFAFAYPSGQGLHVGHVESKTALDILARYYRMNGKNVFFPVGWDAFGLPAENYAIKTSVPPVETTKNAINTFRRQIKRLGISYDWANELATCHPGYYKWTQWLFLQLYKAGLAYQDTGMVNWCPSCQTVLANEQVVDGVCERCEAQVIQKEMKQWFFKITDYKDELISGLDQVDWPEPTKRQQLNWIGKKQGAEVDFIIEVPQDVKFNTNFLFDENYTEVFKAVRQFYFQELSGTSVYSPVLDDNISFTRAFWDHCICQDRKQSQLLYRLYSLPKIFELFYAENSKVFHKVGNDQKKRVEFWIWEKEIEGVQAQVVVRSINKGAKHLYSLVWKGMTEAYQSNKKITKREAEKISDKLLSMKDNLLLDGLYGKIDMHEHYRSGGDVEDFLKAAGSLGISKIVFVPTGLGPDNQGYKIHQSFLIKYIKKLYPEKIIPFCTIDEADPEAAKIFEECLQGGGEGLKLIGGHPSFYDEPLNSENMYKVYEIAAEYQVPVLVHGSIINVPETKSQLEKVYEDFPEVTFIHAHYCSAIFRGINLDQCAQLLDKYPNLYIDLSMGGGIKRYHRYLREDLAKIQDFVLSYQDRILFGSDIILDRVRYKDSNWLYQRIRCDLDLHQKEEYTCDFGEKDVLHQGFNLDKEVLKKLYFENPKKVLNF